jgi:metal-dependent hydrolase (beta-lactamase superfamily II)
MVHADATAEEFETMQKERGETTITLFARAMQAQLSGQIDPAAMGELDTFGLIRILLSRDSAAEFKKALAKSLDQMESLAAAMEGKDGTVILSGRNNVVVNKIKEVLAQKKQRRIAVFYGGAHMPGIELSLTRDMKAKPSGEEWLAAWTMPK